MILKIEIDARGLRCPLPVLKAEKQLDQVEGAFVLEILADDPVARIDIPHLARKRGLGCEIEKHEGESFRFVLTRGMT